jgi:hypothetical protein
MDKDVKFVNNQDIDTTRYCVHRPYWYVGQEQIGINIEVKGVFLRVCLIDYLTGFLVCSWCISSFFDLVKLFLV